MSEHGCVRQHVRPQGFCAQGFFVHLCAPDAQDGSTSEEESHLHLTISGIDVLSLARVALPTSTARMPNCSHRCFSLQIVHMRMKVLGAFCMISLQLPALHVAVCAPGDLSLGSRHMPAPGNTWVAVCCGMLHVALLRPLRRRASLRWSLQPCAAWRALRHTLNHRMLDRHRCKLDSRLAAAGFCGFSDVLFAVPVWWGLGEPGNFRVAGAVVSEHQQTSCQVLRARRSRADARGRVP